MSIESFFLVRLPGGDRTYIFHKMTPSHYEDIKRQHGKVFKINVELPDDGTTHDDETTVNAAEWNGEFGALGIESA